MSHKAQGIQYTQGQNQLPEEICSQAPRLANFSGALVVHRGAHGCALGENKTFSLWSVNFWGGIANEVQKPLLQPGAPTGHSENSYLVTLKGCT